VDGLFRGGIGKQDSRAAQDLNALLPRFAAHTRSPTRPGWPLTGKKLPAAQAGWPRRGKRAHAGTKLLGDIAPSADPIWHRG